jgi:hypothetical protein
VIAQPSPLAPTLPAPLWSPDDVEVLDWRDRQPNPPPLVRGKRKHKLNPRTRLVVERDPRAIDGIVLHQTACTFGPSDDENRRHRRAFGVAGHATAFRDGTVVIANPLQWLVWHGNGFNDRALGLEVEGRYAGLADDPGTAPREDLETTWGGEPDEVTARVIATARRALLELVERGRAAGMPIRYLWAHRQSNGQRRSDPGEALWRAVAIEYGQRELGLELQPALALPSRSSGPGRPIPRAWDPVGGVGRY